MPAGGTSSGTGPAFPRKRPRRIDSRIAHRVAQAADGWRETGPPDDSLRAIPGWTDRRESAAGVAGKPLPAKHVAAFGQAACGKDARDERHKGRDRDGFGLGECLDRLSKAGRRASRVTGMSPWQSRHGWEPGRLNGRDAMPDVPPTSARPAEPRSWRAIARCRLPQPVPALRAHRQMPVVKGHCN